MVLISLYKWSNTWSKGSHWIILLFTSSNNLTPLPEVKFSFTILNAKQERVHNLNYATDPLYWKVGSPGRAFGYPTFVKRDHLIEYLKDDPLIISCKLTICGDRIDTSGQPSNMTQRHILPIPACTLSDDLGLSLRDQNSGNTIIEVEDKEFLVCDVILRARSLVFAAMFQHEMKEQIQIRVTITDFKPKVVEEMLTYIYTGKSPNLQAMANDLLSIADKYSLDRLRMMSADVLSRKLTNENAIEILILADLYRVDELKQFVINFIATNSSHFLGSAVWENIVLSLSSKHPNLIVEMTRALFDSRK